MNGKIKIRHIYKATELKRFHKLEGKYHHMGKTHSGETPCASFSRTKAGSGWR